MLAVAVLIGLATSCDIINPTEDIPTYLYLEKIDLVTNFDQGTASHAITDVWLYVNQQTQGVYEMPVSIPVLEQGKKNVTLRPGIIMNGIASTRTYYPFYKFIDVDYEFVPGKVDSIAIETTYHDDVVFAWLEGFENPGISIEDFNQSDTGISKTSDPDKVFEGNSSAVIYLDSERSFFEGKSTNEYILPGSLAPVYLELNFKTNNEFTVGIMANGTNSVSVLPILVLNETEEWKKVYIYLSNTISRETYVKDFSIYFAAAKISGVDKAEILIDNIKLLHF